MSLLDKYTALTSSSGRQEVSQVLSSIASTPSILVALPVREKLVQCLLDDVAQCSRDEKHGRLTKKDAQSALLAIKTLGRDPDCSQVLSEQNNLKSLLSISKSFRKADSEASNEALRCVANAMLLVEQGRLTWPEIGGGEYAVELLETSNSPPVLFLACRILFLSTVTSSSPLFPTLLNNTPRKGSSKKSGSDIVHTIDTRIDFLMTALLQGQPMGKEALVDLLKFTFNLVVHWPKRCDSPEINMKGKGKSTGGDDSSMEPVFGEIWSERLDRLLPPLLRAFLNLPPTFPSPMSPPLTHIVHALVGIPVDQRLYAVWFPDLPSHSPSRSPAGAAANVPLPSTSSSSGSPTLSPTDKEKDESRPAENKGAFDRAIARLTPRISLSSHSPSRSSSPAPRSADPPTSAVTTMPKVLERASDLFDVSLNHYFPGNIDVDDKSVLDRAKMEDVELDDVLSPLTSLILRLCVASDECRRLYRERIIPPTLDRTAPLEQRADTLGRCIRLMACIRHPRMQKVTGELFYIICESDAGMLSTQIGYGNAAGYLYSKNFLAPPATGPTTTTSSSSSAQQVNGLPINPITGMVHKEPAPSSEPEMTDEEKEREAEKLFVLFERLEKVGGMENPIKKAMREGKMEQYEERMRRKQEEGDDEDD
ncbi:hypothetical protein BD410DRAFT_729913 [Rickenella mellea]|uniref:Uncharacterized protein n=1 Tax=Rickenella mellea TaxID=50990 RepID=A0A4Y7PSK8_9AGAM|nr:hypothetical protein BD410DRAFT_729913 [Rickenella mellea]